MRVQNEAFSAELARHSIGHDYFELAGGHNWALWRLEATAAYTAASERLGSAR
jgi:enterochelin esterase-like enzyme